MKHSAIVALDKCIHGFAAVPEVTAVYADSTHIFVFYDSDKFNVALMDRLYAVFDAYIDDIAYSFKTIYYVPECMVRSEQDIDAIVGEIPDVYIRHSESADDLRSELSGF